MNCSDVLLEIETMFDLPDSINLDVKKHVELCESCGQALKEQSELKRRLQALAVCIKTPLQLHENVLTAVRSARSISEDDIAHETRIPGDFLKGNDSAANSITQELLREDITEVMARLSDHEREILRLRFGLDDGQTKTLEEVATIFGTTREAIRAIESRALRLLRHPNRSRRSRQYLPPDGV